MGDKTRHNAKERELIKSCIIDLVKDKEFLKILSENIAKEVERVFAGKIEALEVRVRELEDERDKLLSKHEAQEQSTRARNLRILGLPTCNRADVEENVRKMFKDSLEIDVPPEAIDLCHQIGEVRNGSQAVLVKFVRYRDRAAVVGVKE